MAIDTINRIVYYIDDLLSIPCNLNSKIILQEATEKVLDNHVGLNYNEFIKNEIGN